MFLRARNTNWVSYWHALPNKLIDVSLSGLPVLSTEQPELKRFIDENGNGITFKGNSQASLEKALNELIESEKILKAKALKVSENVSWEKEKMLLLNLYKNH